MKKNIIFNVFIVLFVLVISIFALTSQKILAATPPTLTTEPPSDISQYSATFHGTLLNTGGEDIYERDFQYGTDLEYGLGGELIFVDPVVLGQYTNESTLSLECGTTYHYRSYARNSAGPGYGGDQEFTTLPCPLPATLITNPASSVGLNSAVLSGEITDVGGGNVIMRGFELFGTSPGGQILSLVNMDNDGPFEAETFSWNGDMPLLSCGTVFNYRSYATNIVGLSYGDYQTFETDDCEIPIVTTESSLISEDTVTLNGEIVNTGGENPMAGFEYGLDTNYGETIEVGNFGAESFSVDVSSLIPEVEYHFRGYALNSAGIGYGEDQTFIIENPIINPTLTTNTATLVKKNSAVLNGSITNIGGENPTVRGFEYGLTDSYGLITILNGFFTTGEYSKKITSTECNATYHYRSYATNSSGTGYGEDSVFVTQPCNSSEK